MWDTVSLIFDAIVDWWDWDTIAIILAFIPAWAFTVFYIWEYRYVKPTPESVHLIGFTLTLALIVTEELVRRLFQGFISSEVHEAFVASTVVLAAAFLWQRFYMLMIHQVLPRRRKQAARKARKSTPPLKKSGKSPKEHS